MADRTAVEALAYADMLVQNVNRLAEATDSATMRMSVIDLVGNLGDEVFRAMNNINSDAEQFGANFTDDGWHEVRRAVCQAAAHKGAGHD